MLDEPALLARRKLRPPVLAAGHSGAEVGREADAGDLPGLFRRHHAELLRLAVLIVRDKPTAEDVVQDVFTRLHARGHRAGDLDDALVYLRAAILNGCRSVLRRKAIGRRLQVMRDWPYSSSTTRSAEQEAIRAEDRDEVLRALAALPARRREVLVLRYYLNLSEAEIAVTLGISPGTVKSTAARGIAALARSLKEES
jgi:RNA polymerase sigma-70 factor (sigma-E family)